MDRILVATDFSTRSDRALRRAILIAKRLGATLSLAHVVDGDQAPAMIEAERAAASSTLSDMARTIEQVDGLSVAAKVTIDDVFPGILAAADEAGAQLIVIGPHRRRLRDIFIGTTAERIVRHSQRPLLVAIQVPSAPYARTILALDFDDASRSAGRAALAMGLFEHMQVVVMHAFDTPARGMMQRSMEVPAAIDDYVAAEGREAAGKLEALVRDLSLPASSHRAAAIRGSPARSILECAQSEGADLIVVGANKRKGFERLLIGSVTEEVLREAERDILIVPADAEPTTA